MSTPREAYVIQDTTGEWFYAIEGNRRGDRWVSGGPFESRDEAETMMYRGRPNPGGYIPTHVNQWGKNSRFHRFVADARAAHEKTQEGIRNDGMPRKEKQVDRAKMLNMRSTDEIMNTTLGAIDPGPEQYREDGTDPNSFEKVAGIKMAKKSRAISRKQRKGLDEDCGPQEIDLGLHDGMEVVAGLLGMNQDGEVSMDQAGDDFTLDDDWFDTATQELLDRTSTGEDWVVLVSELSRRFSEFFDGSYAAFSFAADAFGRRAWKMGMVESQNASENFDLTESFYGDKFPLMADHAPVRVSKDEFTRFVREERLTDHKGHKFVWFVDRAGKARAGIHETGHYIWQMKTPTVTHRGIVFRVGHPDLVETKTFTIYAPTNRMIKFGK